MLLMGGIGDSEYYTDSEEFLNDLSLDKTPLKLEDYLNGDYSKAEFLGLISDTEYSKEAYGNFYNGFKADGSESYIKQQENHKAGYDIVATFDKSISLLYATLNPEQRKEFDKIVRESTNELVQNDFGKYLKPSCKKSEYKDFENEKTELAAAVFTHYENRDQDPHYHLHINLFNFAKFTMQDGTEKTFAVDPEDLFKAQKTLSAKLNNKLAYRLSEHFDISIEQKDETIKVKGIDDKHINQFSSRKEEVLNEFKKQQEKKHNGNNGEGKIYTSESQLRHDFQEHERAKYLESIRKGTAKQKEELSYNQLMKHFDKLIQAETDLTFDKIKESKIHSKLSDDEITKQIIKIMEDLTSNNAEFTQQQFDKAVYQEFAGKIPIDDAAKFIEKHLPVQHKPIELENKNFTTKDAAIKSFETIALIEKLKDKSFDSEIFNTSKMNYRNAQQVVDVFEENLQKKNKSFTLNEFQKKAMVIATNNKAISHITGDAGTGKTSTVIKFANSIYSVDRDVYGLSTQTKTATSLTEAGIKKENTFNLTNFSQKLKAINFLSSLIVFLSLMRQAWLG